MDTTALIVWQSFLQTSSAEQRGALMHCISRELSEELEGLPTLTLEGRGVSDELARVHYSWLAPYLRSLPESEVKLFLSSLSPDQIKGLKKTLLLSNSLPTPSALGKTYLTNTLFEMIATEDLIPSTFLPKDPLNDLLNLSQQEFSSLIDLLSMHDLSIEMRHVIETSKLNEIYRLLTKAQTTFLKTLLHKKEPVAFKKMGLLSWKGDKEALKSMLLQRGINRIAKSLYGKNPSLLWHVAHRMESERGQILIKLCTPLDHPRASSLLTDQVVELMSALKNHTPPEEEL